MKVLVAMDEFHGIISSYQANRYVEEAVASQIETADVVQVPLFNGRHELLDSVFLWQSGQKYRIPVHDADMNEVEGVYGQTDTGMTVIEGNLFLKGKKPIVERTSYGLGEMIKHALDNDAKHVVISLGGIAAVLNGLYQAEILTSHALVDQLTHLENLVEQADLIIFGEGLNENDQLLETTTLRIAELCHKHQKVAIAICATAEKFDLFESQGVTAMFNTFIDMPETYTDFKMGLQIRHYTVQSLKLLKTHFNVEV